MVGNEEYIGPILVLQNEPQLLLVVPLGGVIFRPLDRGAVGFEPLVANVRLGAKAF